MKKNGSTNKKKKDVLDGVKDKSHIYSTSFASNHIFFQLATLVRPVVGQGKT